jgi:Flp pilus assembly pilin Flp
MRVVATVAAPWIIGTSMARSVPQRLGESGQTMAEYAVVLGIIVVAVLTTIGLLSPAVQTLVGNAVASI